MKSLLAVLLLGLLSACGAADISRESYVFGTRVEITVAGEDAAKAEPVINAALADLDRWHAELHAWQKSPVTTLNMAIAAGKSAPVTTEMVELIQQSQWAWRQSEGLFNPAMGGLIAAWGFHSDTFAPLVPDQKVIQAWLTAQPSPVDVLIHQQQASSHNSAVQLDFGGIAKGWALDRIAKRFKEAGIKNALINIGGNILALGKHGAKPWHIGLQHPRQQQAMLELDLLDGEAIGTSGDYQRFFLLNGKRYSHLLDPRVGIPASASMSATALVDPSPQAGLTSDAATKPLFIAGPEHAAAMAKRFNVRNWLVVSPTGTVYLSQSMQPRVHWLISPPQVRVIQP